MPQRALNEDDSLDDFERRAITLDGATKVVHVAGTGPAVIVMTEMPGISPHVARFGRWVRDAGFTIYLPSLFGRDGAVPHVEEGQVIFRQACVSAEFHAFAADESSPVTAWLRALARLAHRECGGPGVGAIGMCYTAAVRQRLERDDLTVLAYRFEGDRFCTAQRFAAYARALGDRFVGRVLPDSAANRDTPPFFERVVACPHSVVTVHLIDEAGQPTLAARDEILSFFARRLAPSR